MTRDAMLAPILVAYLALLMASCGTPVSPWIPRPVPAAETVTPPALRTAFVEASNRLRIYLAQPPCAPSGAVACLDPIEARDALAAKQRAWSALNGLRHGTGSERSAKTHVEVFAAIVGNLPIGATP